ncbi:hypothetical protein XELAEV_18026850mg [Xenopus laevis]|uniref:Uncharacterized protein n=1 Tax=Xenopus laevis TaxID=8355 RepID=A0A974CV58_XENLA|nr:hypothetical protein XELAEV_18026850mg [Xenopus laevis]
MYKKHSFYSYIRALASWRIVVVEAQHKNSTNKWHYWLYCNIIFSGDKLRQAFRKIPHLSSKASNTLFFFFCLKWFVFWKPNHINLNRIVFILCLYIYDNPDLAHYFWLWALNILTLQWLTKCSFYKN